MTDDPAAPLFDHSVTKTYAVPGAVDDVRVRVRLTPVALEVVASLVASGDLDPAYTSALPIYSLAGTQLEWEGDARNGAAGACREGAALVGFRRASSPRHARLLRLDRSRHRRHPAPRRASRARERAVPHRAAARPFPQRPDVFLPLDGDVRRGDLEGHRGASWSWVCEQAVGYQSSENPTQGDTENNALLIATFEGLGITTDRGCTWTLGVGGITDNAEDLVVEGSDPHSALVLSSGYQELGDAGPLYNNRIWVTHDDGATFTQVGQPLDPEIIVQTIDVAPSDATRVYVSGTRQIDGVANGVLLRSTDGAQTFAETDFPLISGDAGLLDREPYIAAVDPTNPNRVYVRVENVDGTRLLVSDDGLATTRQAWQAKGPLLGFALSADGTKVYVGGPNDGLYHTSRRAPRSRSRSRCGAARSSASRARGTSSWPARTR